MELAYRQFNLASANGFLLKKSYSLTSLDRDARLLPDPSSAFSYTNPLLRILHGGWSKDLLNAREASGMYHLPQEAADLPLVQRLPTKQFLASPQLARRIESEPTATPPVLIGYSEQRGHKVPFYYHETALYSHKFFIARSRYGKSTLMQLLIEGAMQIIRPLPPEAPPPYIGAGKQPAIIVVDPHGDLISDIMKLPITHYRKNDVMLIDLADIDYPCGINLLDAGLGFTRDQAIADMMSSLGNAWKDFWGPRMAYYLSHVLQTLFCVNEHLCAEGKRHEQYTLLDVNAVLQQPEYARTIISKLDKNNRQEMELISWWRDTYFKLNDKFKQEVISPILSKMGVFSDKQTLQRIVGQPITTVNILETVKDGKICLISLNSKELEEDAVGILGATLINLTHRAMQSQSSIRLSERRRVFVAIDEFQNIPGADYGKLLSEDGKYGCAMMLASQNLERLNQVKEGLLGIVLSNCEQLCAFSCNSADAEILKRELHERVSTSHIMSQPRLHCYVRMSVPSYPIQIASITLAKPGSWQLSPEGDQHEQDIRDENRKRYRPSSEVDQDLLEHIKRYEDLQPYTDMLNEDIKKAKSARAKRDNQRKKAAEMQESAKKQFEQVSHADQQMEMAEEQQPSTPNKQVARPEEKRRRTRNHSRSKRKKAAGLPPLKTQEADGQKRSA